MENLDLFLVEMAEKLQAAVIELTPILEARSWLTWSQEDKNALRKFVKTGDVSFNKFIRPPFDKAINENRLVANVKNVRKPNEYDGDKPGKPAKSMATKLAEALND